MTEAEMEDVATSPGTPGAPTREEAGRTFPSGLRRALPTPPSDVRPPEEGRCLLARPRSAVLCPSQGHRDPFTPSRHPLHAQCAEGAGTRAGVAQGPAGGRQADTRAAPSLLRLSECLMGAPGGSVTPTWSTQIVAL